MSVKIMWVSMSVLWSVITMASPPVDILQSCKNMKSANSTIIMTELKEVGLRELSEADCREQFEGQLNENFYGWGVCDNKPYLLIANKKIFLKTAVNFSINPAIKPEIPIVSLPLWWRIDKDDKSWLCMVSPLTDRGQGSNSFQYYLVEDAFDGERDNYALYFYFFDKNVSKIM